MSPWTVPPDVSLLTYSHRIQIVARAAEVAADDGDLDRAADQLRRILDLARAALASCQRAYAATEA